MTAPRAAILYGLPLVPDGYRLCGYAKVGGGGASATGLASAAPEPIEAWDGKGFDAFVVQRVSMRVLNSLVPAGLVRFYADQLGSVPDYAFAMDPDLVAAKQHRVCVPVFTVASGRRLVIDHTDPTFWAGWNSRRSSIHVHLLRRDDSPPAGFRTCGFSLFSSEQAALAGAGTYTMYGQTDDGQPADAVLVQPLGVKFTVGGTAVEAFLYDADAQRGEAIYQPADSATLYHWGGDPDAVPAPEVVPSFPTWIPCRTARVGFMLSRGAVGAPRADMYHSADGGGWALAVTFLRRVRR